MGSSNTIMKHLFFSYSSSSMIFTFSSFLEKGWRNNRERRGWRVGKRDGWINSCQHIGSFSNMSKPGIKSQNRSRATGESGLKKQRSQEVACLHNESGLLDKQMEAGDLLKKNRFTNVVQQKIKKTLNIYIYISLHPTRGRTPSTPLIPLEHKRWGVK